MTGELTFDDQTGDGVQEKVLELAMPYLEGGKIFIAGSGQGALEYKLLKAGVGPADIQSVDYDPKQFKHKNINIQFCDLNGPVPFDSDSFDFCFSTEVIEHLYNPHNLINEVWRVLKPGGIFFMSTPNVHSFMQKIRYLFSDRLGWFFERDYLGSGHIHPIFDWLLERMVRGKFEQLAYDSQSFHLRLIPRLPPIPMPFKHRFFAMNNIYVFKKVSND